MFCPECSGEYRDEITRCPTCDVDLVTELADDDGESEPPPSERPLPATSELADYCGFLSIEEARQARDLLRREGIASEIVLRDDTSDTPSSSEEYWLRVPEDSFSKVTALLGYGAEEEPAAAEDDDSFSCSDCGKSVSANESFCPHCGARFDE